MISNAQKKNTPVCKMFSWDSFYSDTSSLQNIESPSSFAAFVCFHLPPSAKIVDIGSGNGRDACFFQSFAHDVTAVDPSVCALSVNEAKNKMLSTAEDICESENHFDVVYMRFSLHSVSEDTENKLFSWARHSKLFCIETRSVFDPRYGRGELVATNAFSDNGHYRRFTKLDDLVQKALEHNYKILHASVDFNAAVTDHDKAVVNRLILSCT